MCQELWVFLKYLYFLNYNIIHRLSNSFFSSVHNLFKCCATIIANSRTFSSPQKETLYPLAITLPSLPPALGKPRIHSRSLWICLFRMFHINRIAYCVVFWVWFLSLSIMFPKFIHVVACVSASLLFKAESYSIVWMEDTVFIHSSTDGH